MRNKCNFFRVLTTIVISIALFSCGGGGSNTGGDTDLVAQANSVLVVGDSISTGFNLATPWPDRLSNFLNISINNSFSEDGVQTNFGLTYLDSALTDLQPSHVIIFMGTNDAIRGSVSGAIANLREMVNISNGQNVSVIIATLPVITRSSSENARAAQISNAIRDFNGVQVADIRNVFGSGAGLIADGIHPNDDGQQLIADTMADFF